MYAPFAMLFPEESGRQRLSFQLGARNPFGLPAAAYELYDIYPAMQEAPVYDIFLNVTGADSEILATLFCQLDARAHEISLSISELHLQRPEAPALLAAVEVQFNQSRGQNWAELLQQRAERMQSAFLKTLPDGKPKPGARLDDSRLLRDEALEMLLAHSNDPEEQVALIDTLVQEMRQMMLSELDSHRPAEVVPPRGNNIIQFPGRRQSEWDTVHWLELHIALKELPEIWRHINVPASLTLTQLHRVLQTVMGWHERGAWRFVHPRGEYISHSQAPGLGLELWNELDADKISLGELLVRKGGRIDYEYGAPGQWVHQIRVLQRHKPGALPPVIGCLEGAMASPPEDSGSPEGFRQLQRILIKKRQSRADKLLLAELAGYDPLRFEPEAINRQLQSLTKELQTRA